MYGTVARMKVKPGRLDDLKELFDEWGRERQPRIEGAVSGYLYKLDGDPNGAVMVAVFRDKDSYVANADDPEQDKFFRRIRDCLEADPEWNDGEIIASS